LNYCTRDASPATNFNSCLFLFLPNDASVTDPVSSPSPLRAHTTFLSLNRWLNIPVNKFYKLQGPAFAKDAMQKYTSLFRAWTSHNLWQDFVDLQIRKD